MIEFEYRTNLLSTPLEIWPRENIELLRKKRGGGFSRLIKRGIVAGSSLFNL
jgi:hypothetical protein